MTHEERKLLGMKGRQHVSKNYNFENFKKQWVNLIDSVVENHGSWEDRKNYKPWAFTEITK